MALVSVGLGWLVAGRALRPLARITATARRLSAEQLDQRIGMRGPADELKELADTFDSMLDRHQAETAGRRPQVTTELAPAAVDGDPVLLASLVDNLVANAVRHNVDGGWLHASTTPEGDQARLVVASSGPVVPADRVEDLFEPFQRLDRDRSRSQRGAGLGPSIVRTVALAHHGHVDASPLDAGGLQVTIALPALGAPGAPTPNTQVPRQTDHAQPDVPTATPP